MELNIAYFYPEQLNLYGDTGNVDILAYRAKKRGIIANILKVGLETRLDSSIMSHVHIVFMGGGPDSGQKLVYKDILEKKQSFLKEHVESNKVGLFVCGAYQLLGKYYKSADGTVLEGLGIYNLYTEHFGNHKPRCIGNTLATIDSSFQDDPLFRLVNHVGDDVVGFENHGGRTYLFEGVTPFAHIKTGYGNNAEDGTEGVHYKNTIGTYFHGPLLAANPHIADYLIAKALNLFDIKELDDSFTLAAHTAHKKLKQ
ncbi:glutamine amidotransferase [candidate division WWE3 bacterium]|uniref:Lipid II isoglutaminyl synthase (glutamine-hydrolyzing) subunit GatD n=1 Tax=candidate division WWE3 bacterium TaxID=2053526 RepID=A0A7X9HHC0_UNCKA|nr:glutamine amidotransferase [candidate division WWE3 bacterium]